MAETTMAKLTNTESNSDLKEEEEEVASCEEEKLSIKGDFNEEMLLSLPREKGWAVPYIYFFQQFWCNPSQLKATVSFQKYFQAKHNDIVLSTLPKAGTTWLKALAFALVNRNHFIPSQNDHPLLVSNSHTLVPLFEFDLYNDKLNNVNPDLSTLPEPRIFATHLPFSSLSPSIYNSNCKIIYVCRNPFDSFISYWHFSNNIVSSRSLPVPALTLEEAFEKYSEGIHPFGPFWSHQLGYWKASKNIPNKVLFLKYEDLKANPNSELKRMSQFLDCPFTIEEENAGVIDSIVELCSFQKMKELEVNKSGKAVHHLENKYYFRKGETNDWVNYFSPSMTEKLSKIIEEKFAESDLSF